VQDDLQAVAAVDRGVEAANQIVVLIDNLLVLAREAVSPGEVDPISRDFSRPDLADEHRRPERAQWFERKRLRGPSTRDTQLGGARKAEFACSSSISVAFPASR